MRAVIEWCADVIGLSIAVVGLCCMVLSSYVVTGRGMRVLRSALLDTMCGAGYRLVEVQGKESTP